MNRVIFQRYIFLSSTLFVLILASGMTATAEELPSIHPRILNGQDYSSSYVPSVVSISPAGSDPISSNMCGGTIVDSHHVLTAAHCVADFKRPDDFQILAGRVRLRSSEGVLLQSDGFVVHPQFDSNTFDNDLAIIRTAKPLPDVAVSLHQDGETPPTAQIMGWGYMDSNYPIRANTLQEAVIPIINNEDCQSRLGVSFNPETMLCAGKLASSPTAEDGIDTCFGDSGGPLFIQKGNGVELLGVVSWGFVCGSNKYWGVYSKISSQQSWLNPLPNVPPRLRSKPKISGVLKLGKTLRCNPARWSGDPITSKNFVWKDEKGKQIGHGAKLRVSHSTLGKRISCTMVARNQGGEARASSSPISVR